MTTNEKSSLITRYEILRRKESEAMHSLLDTLNRVDGLPDGQIEQARDALFHADNPYLIVLVGAFNTGKSSLINALIGESILETGATPTTNRIMILRHGPALQRLQSGDVETIFFPHPLLEKVSIVDTPGLDSVFKGHDQTTHKFLHRADLVLMVMLATQAMSAANVEALSALRAYGKRVLIAINQVDLISSEEQDTLRNFIAEQSRQQLGFVPEIWMLSAKLAQESQRQSPQNEELWKASGMDKLEHFINRALSDAERVRQKLETPLQISRNVLSSALGTVREQQAALADYDRSARNVRGQMEAGLREQNATLHQHLAEIDAAFAESISRGREAIRDTFQWSKAASLALNGLLEITGLGRFFRRFGAQTPAQAAFEGRKVSEPLDQIPSIADRLGPRLEGRDVKDVDDLIGYTRKEMEQLPASLKEKVIGKLAAPTTYDRNLMRSSRDSLLALIDQGRLVEFKTIDSKVRNSIILLGLYELFILLIGVIAIAVAANQQNNAWPAYLIIMVVFMVLGLLLIPLRGVFLERAYAKRMRQLKSDYLARLEKSAQDQIAYGKQLRQDAIAPFMRLVETQVDQINKVRSELDKYQQVIADLEKELGVLKQ